DGLMEAIDKATKGAESKRDTSGIPVKGDKYWEVERDTLSGGWLAVARAVAAYAESNVATLKTYADIVEAIQAEAAGYAGSDTVKANNYCTILEYFKFGSKATGVFTTQETVTLNIGVGFDLLAFKDVNSIEDKTYSTAVLKFTPKSAGDNTYILSNEDDISFTTTDFIEVGTDVTAIKDVLTECIAADTFKTWFTKSVLQTDELGDLTRLLAQFDTVMGLAGLGYTEAQIWDHFVAPEIGKTYTETKVWYNTSGARAQAEVSAAGYKNELDALLGADITAMDAFALRAHYIAVNGVVQRIDSDIFSTLVYQIMNEIEADYIGKANYKVEKYIKELGIKVGQAYAIVALANGTGDVSGENGFFTLADKLVEIEAAAETEITKSSDVELSEDNVWQDTEEYKATVAWLNEAAAIISLIDTYVLATASFADLVETKTDKGNAITEELYNKVAGLVGEVTLDVFGSTYFDDKAHMDSVMANTILEGRNFTTIEEICEDFVDYYNKALGFKNDPTMETVYNAVYPDGLDDYAAYINTLKAAAAKAYYDSMAVIDGYYTEAGKVAYYTFESIISKADAISTSTGTYMTVAQFLDRAPAYVPGKDDYTKDQLLELYNKIWSASGYYNTAVNFKNGLNNLRNLAYTNAANNQVVDKKILAYILRQENVTGSAYAWESCIGALNVDKIREYVNEIELVQQTGIETNLGKVTPGGIETLMSNAVEDLDRILISDDLGTLLNSLTAKENEETGATVGFLGVWGFDYTFKNPNGGTTTVKAGDPCK
ncbi:MAG: hypothetical protein II237_07585, partial [Clostridia bacterium]|nr:hypothetical protein [Clostridia bacterium]